MAALTVTLSPKINQPGESTAPASDACAVGTAALSPAQDRTIRVLTRPRGSDAPWSILRQAQGGRDGLIRFDAWGGQEYRAVAPATDTQPRVESDTATYDWSLVFTDEFDGDTLGNAWTHRGQSYRDDATRAKGDPAAVTVCGGAAHVKAIPDPDAGEGWWLNGHIGTQQGFQFVHGWAAARVKVHRWAGSHCAFWLQSPAPPYCEVDVAEWFGSDSSEPDMRHNVYYDHDGDTATGLRLWRADTPGSWWEQYHVYAVHWTPEGYSFHIDGKCVGRAAEGLSATPKFLILSMVTKDYERARMREDRRYTMHVDWVRVWQ